MTELEIKNIVESGETETIEFKEKFSKEVIETIVAFSNRSGGKIFLGITNNNSVLGINVNEENIKEWTNSIKQATQPQIFPEIGLHKIDSKIIASIIVQEYPIKPVSYKGRFFKRVGASNHQITAKEITDLHLRSINSSFDSFIADSSLDSLDIDLINNYFSQLNNAGRVKLENDNFKSLVQIGLIKENKPTFASLLLFGNHKTNIHIGRFKSNDIIIDDILIKSPLVVAVDEAMTFIKKSISLKYDFDGNLRRKETWQYPLSVIRELLLNSVIHKDYRNPTDIIIKVFDDKIAFINPGNLMAGLKAEDLLRGEYLAVHRNKLLAEAFYLRGTLKNLGLVITELGMKLINTII